ncbi:hypothetical protein [Lactococcus lactis]|uniref:hypothetical protein n=1 Tax=Lactococcus lactis TaxID=1358 RepID=UPI001F583C0F|nr:hypothetical protein [Lactococcus lactis]
MGNWDWSAIFTGCAVAVSLIALWLQRRDLKKQAKYQRDTFELQNIINENNILIDLAAEVIGNIQNQVQVLETLYQEENFKRSSENNILELGRLRPQYEVDPNDFKEQRDNKQKAEEKIEELNDFMKDLTKELTDKGNAIQLQMSGSETYDDVRNIMKEIQELLSDMRLEIESVDQDVVFKKVEILNWAKQYTDKEIAILDKFRDVFIDKKGKSSKKLEEMKLEV